MPANIPLRHELKFFISEMQYQVLSRQLDRVLWRDPNGDENNEYHIRSLYFDTIFDDAYYDKLDGVQNRNKYRIRIYNMQDKVIKLECKTKVGSLISKRSLTIPRDLADQLIAGDTTDLEKTRSGLLGDVFREMTCGLLRPVVIVDYVREAYLHPAEEVRITFDMSLRSGLSSVDLFNRQLPTVCPHDRNVEILEVKFNNYLPGYIAGLLHGVEAERSAVSKYVLCRRYEPLG